MTAACVTVGVLNTLTREGMFRAICPHKPGLNPSEGRPDTCPSTGAAE